MIRKKQGLISGTAKKDLPWLMSLVPIAVLILGARGEIWDGFYKKTMIKTYILIVDTTRDIIDSVDPKVHSMQLEPMPWMIPDSPDSYLKLIKDIDRKAFGVHLILPI